MKNNLKIALLGAMLLLSFGCQKKEIEQAGPKTETSVSISMLKKHMSELINIKESDIYFDEKTEIFSIAGIEQISKKELTESYHRSNK